MEPRLVQLLSFVDSIFGNDRHITTGKILWQGTKVGAFHFMSFVSLSMCSNSNNSNYGSFTWHFKNDNDYKSC